MNSIRIDPADNNGIHLVQNEGGERVYLFKKDIEELIVELEKVLRR